MRIYLYFEEALVKTTQVMTRTLFDRPVRQFHNTRMLCANDLAAIYREKNPSATLKLPSHFMDNAATKEYVAYLEQVVGVPANEVYRTTKGRDGATWMHPYLFVDFAMWLSVEFKHEALKWIHDNLCTLRDSVGTDHRPLTDEIKKLGADKPWHYIREIQLIQGLAGIRNGERNTATEDQLRKLDALQKADIKMIQQGVTSYGQRRSKLIELADLLG